MTPRSDPEAAALLAELGRLELGRWPDGVDAYRAGLLALAQRCETRPAAVAEVYHWAREAVAAYLHAVGPELAECRADALVDVALGAAGLLLRWRAGVHEGRRPNLASMVRYRVRARGKDLYVTRHRRHHGPQRRRASPSALDRLAAMTADPSLVVYAAKVVRLLDDSDPARRALLWVGAGASIAEAARRTGASRQQVYRCRALVAGEMAPDDCNPSFDDSEA